MKRKRGLFGKLFESHGHDESDPIADADHARRLLTAGDERTARDIEQAIALLTRSLISIDSKAQREHWISTKGNLAGALMELESGDRADNLRSAITHYNELLHELDETRDRERWIATQVNIGWGFLDYANEFDYAEDMAPRAIEAFEAALPHSPGLVREKHALASVLLDCPIPDRAAGFERSAELFQDVVRHHAEEGPPIARGLALRGRAWALMHLAAELDSCEAFRDTVACMKQYVKIASAEAPADGAEALEDLTEIRENYEGTRCAEEMPFDDIPPPNSPL